MLLLLLLLQRASRMVSLKYSVFAYNISVGSCACGRRFNKIINSAFPELVLDRKVGYDHCEVARANVHVCVRARACVHF